MRAMFSGGLGLAKLWKSERHGASLGLAAIALAALLWAIAAVVARTLFQAGVMPFELTTSRAVIAAIGLGLTTQIWSVRRARVKRWDARILALGLCLALVTATYYVAISRLPVAIAIVIQYAGLTLVVVAGALRRRQVPEPSVLAALLAALLGVALLSGVFSSQFQLDSLGLMAAVLSGLFFASYTLLSEAVVNTYGPLGVMARGFLISSLFWLPIQLTQAFPQALFAAENLPGILFVGIGGTLVPFSLMCWGIQQVKADRGAIAATLEPAFSAVLAWIWLGQTLTSMQILGGMLVLGAVLLLQIRQK